MPLLDRQVRRLRLRATHDDHVRHGQVLIEDALRTATLGDEARLIIVRRLDLGVVSSQANSTQWSRRIEESFRKTSPVPISVHDRSAPHAAAVYFADHDEPWLQLAHRTLAQQLCTEWYWRSALPGWKPSLSPTETLRVCVRTLAARGGLPPALRLFTALPSTAAIDSLLQSLESADLAPLRAALGHPPSPLGIESPSTPANRSFPSLTELERCLIQLWGLTDIRTHFLAALRLAFANPSSISVLRVPTATAKQIQALVQHWQRETIAPLQRTTTPPNPAASFAPADVAKPAATSPSRPLTPDRVPSPEDAPPTANEPPASLERLFTRAGGLFFLLPLLGRARLPAFIKTLPDAERTDYPWQILRLALRHARTAAADPLVIALNELPATTQPLGHWLLSANRHALRLTGMNLRVIICRPALVTLTPTHAAVFFRAAEAELRLRRAGLDLDPGWVPWLGRAVSYHFNRED